jgi:membrane protein YdbS with pleckstrin-like domain
MDLEPKPQQEFENAGIDIANLPRLEEVEFVPLEPKYLMVLRLQWLLYALIPPIVLSLIPKLPDNIRWGAIIVWAFIMIFQLVDQHLSFGRMGYALRQHDVSYRKGWFFRSLTSIPFNRVQHCEVEQGPIDRLFTLSTLMVYTAGGSGSDIKIPGLKPETAQQLRNYIIELAASKQED